MLATAEKALKKLVDVIDFDEQVAQEYDCTTIRYTDLEPLLFKVSPNTMGVYCALRWLHGPISDLQIAEILGWELNDIHTAITELKKLDYIDESPYTNEDGSVEYVYELMGSVLERIKDFDTHEDW